MEKPSKKYTITRDKFMNPDEFKKLLKVCSELSELDLIKGRQTWITRYMLVSLALRSGLRVKEIADIKIGDIHLGKENYLSVKEGKGNKARDVYFNGELLRHLKRYIEIKGKSWLEPVGEGNFLFSHGKEGKQFTTTALHISFKQALRKAGLSLNYSIHSARHTYATMLLEDTGDLRGVQKQLGHQNIAMTALYADLMPERRQALADMLTI